MNAENFAPPDLQSAVLMILNYGKEHDLTPVQLSEIFYEGIGTGITLRFAAYELPAT
jgi:hypothetical protein